MLNVLSFWHNSFSALIGDRPEELKGVVEAQFGTASAGGDADLPAAELAEVERAYREDDPTKDLEPLHSGLQVLASIAQGHQLRVDAEFLDYPMNGHHGGKLIIADKDAAAADLGHGLGFTVAGPMLPEVAELQKKHQEWLKDLKEKGRKPPQALAAYVDPSVTNLSSIVVLAEREGKRMLLTGDARGDKILEGLELVDALAPGGSMHVDLLKVPHHGSDNNVEQGFFERITADHYVFSGDGEHGNPERKAFEMLFDARKGARFTIHLTYPLEDIDAERKRERGAGWSDAEHGLQALFDARLRPGQSLRIAPEKGRHVIDLLDPYPH